MGKSIVERQSRNDTHFKVKCETVFFVSNSKLLAPRVRQSSGRQKHEIRVEYSIQTESVFCSCLDL